MLNQGKSGEKLVAIDRLENRRLLSNTTVELVQEPITIGVPTLKDITFTAGNGRRTNISVTGATAAISFPGPAALTFYKGHAYFPSDTDETISSIVVYNAIPNKATLKETGAYGTGMFDIGSILGGNLGSVIAPDVNVTNSVTLSSVNRLTLGEVSGATLNLGSSAAAIKISGPLTGAVAAGNIGSLSAQEISEANITTSDKFSRSKLEIGSIDGGLGIFDSNIVSAGSIGSIKTAALLGSVITAATNAPAASAGISPNAELPQSSLAIVSPASIGSLTIAAKSITSPAYFSDSIVAADTIGSLQLGQIDGGGGVSAEKIGSLSAMGPSGGLDRFPFHMGPAQLHTAAKVQSSLTHLNIPFSTGTNLPEDTVFYDFNLNLLI